MRKGNEPFAQWVKHLESKAKLIPHTGFMIAPKISKKDLVHGSCSLQFTKKRYVNEIIIPLI